jgi:hypothetical protein
MIYNVKISATIQVEADTEKEAVDAAYARYYEFRHDTTEEVEAVR